MFMKLCSVWNCAANSFVLIPLAKKQTEILRGGFSNVVPHSEFRVGNECAVNFNFCATILR